MEIQHKFRIKTYVDGNGFFKRNLRDAQDLKKIETMLLEKKKEY